jgi:hypothetical protein
MPTTRAATGNSKPRVIAAIENTVAPKKSTKANTSKPRAKKVTAGRVEKKKAPAKAATTKKTTVKKTAPKAVKDKVVGKAKKAVGAVEGKPAKKVCARPVLGGCVPAEYGGMQALFWSRTYADAF